MHFDSNYKFEDIITNKFDVNSILVKLNAKHPQLAFFQYEEKLRNLDVLYLGTANEFETHFYQSSVVGMTEEAAGLFRRCVSMEYSKALLAHERGKMRGRGLQITSDHESVVPVYYS